MSPNRNVPVKPQAMQPFTPSEFKNAATLSCCSLDIAMRSLLSFSSPARVYVRSPYSGGAVSEKGRAHGVSASMAF
jgi:hypothetical protein